MADKKCVYCGAVGSMTREHVVPRCILQRVPPNSMRYVESADKVILTDQVIKDVCKTCNGGVLSKLDAYGCMLFDQQFCNPPVPGLQAIFRYDFNQLSRWLLKISFNSARSSKHSDATTLALYAADIISGTTPNITICLELIEPVLAESETESGIFVVQTVNPTTVRIARIQFKDGFVPILHIVRLVAIQGFWFSLVVPTSDTCSMGERISEQQAIISKWPNISVLPSNSAAISLTTLGNDVIEMSKDTILDKMDLYKAAMDAIDAKRSVRDAQ